jgi:CubicO group peptidase (beta-lactamase class C family)
LPRVRTLTRRLPHCHSATLRFGALLPLLPLLPQLALAQSSPPPGWTAFTRQFDAYAATDSVVGASVWVLSNGEVIARHEYGWADRALRQRVDTGTIFHWASITKTLTAIAVMQLRDRGRLSLNDPVTTWIPELRQVHDPYGSMDSVTIAMLLSHAAGFQAPTWPWTKGRPWEPFEPQHWGQLVAMMPYEELLFKPGTRYSYSNPGFVYLARIIELITDDPWENYVQKNILSPLHLTRSYFGTTPYYLQAERSNNYTVEGDTVTGRDVVVANGRDFDPGITIPNSGWNAPLGDLATYLDFLTGATPNDSVLSHATLEEMWRARYVTNPSPTVPDSIGLSFFVLHRAGQRFVGHTGDQAGFRSFMYLNPETRTAVVANFNTRNDAQYRTSGHGFSAVGDSALALIARLTQHTTQH